MGKGAGEVVSGAIRITVSTIFLRTAPHRPLPRLPSPSGYTASVRQRRGRECSVNRRCPRACAPFRPTPRPDGGPSLRLPSSSSVRARDGIAAWLWGVPGQNDRLTRRRPRPPRLVALSRSFTRIFQKRVGGDPGTPTGKCARNSPPISRPVHSPSAQVAVLRSSSSCPAATRSSCSRSSSRRLRTRGSSRSQKFRCSASPLPSPPRIELTPPTTSRLPPPPVLSPSTAATSRS
jgi:hypothetical protein